MTDVSIIITAHRERLYLPVTGKSAAEAIRQAQDELGITTETIVVLDNADQMTRDLARHCFADDARIIKSSAGDPGVARNLGLGEARGRFSTLLDGDDLWSRNWLTSAVRMGRERPDAVLHSHCNVVFGAESNVWWHINSEGSLFLPEYLEWANYWDAMSFAETALYQKMPFRANDLKQGFGHEDWHWNIVTTDAGIAHKPVEGTVHFKRRRSGSQMANANKSDAVPWPRHLRKTA